MKRIVLSVIIACMVIMSEAQTLRVATYNIRFDNPRDTLDLWKNRSPYVAGLIRLYDFDIFGTQEGLDHQLSGLKNSLGGYDFIGVGRDDGKRKGEYTAIFYKTDKFKLMDAGTFWLSTEIGKPNKGWDAALPRICTWGKFKESGSGIEFYFFNTHFDHIGVQARSESAKLILEMIRKTAGNNPVVLTGDLNFDEKNPNFRIFADSEILHDAYEVAEFRYAPGGTFTGFDITAKPEGRIDHIFVSEPFKVKRYGILTNTYQSRYPSDHFAVFAELIYR